jgi:hypothetical protein
MLTFKNSSGKRFLSMRYLSGPRIIGRIALLVIFSQQSFAGSYTKKTVFDQKNNEIFSHYLTGIPARYGSCDHLKETVGSRFLIAVDNPLVQVRCSQTQGASTVEVVYRSEAKVNFGSTVDYQNQPLVSEKGFFKTEAECDTHRDADTAVYLRETGSKLIAAYCMKVSMGIKDSHPWLLRVDSSPFVSKKFVRFHHTFGSGFSLDEDLLSEAATNLNSLDGVVSYRLVFNDDINGFQGINAGYFVDGDLSLKALDSGAFRWPGECEAERGEFLRATQSLGSFVLASRCVSASNKSYMLSLNAIPKGQSLALRGTRISYANYEACSSDRSRVQALLLSLNWHVGGVVCIEGGSNYEAFAFVGVPRSREGGNSTAENTMDLLSGQS